MSCQYRNINWNNNAPSLNYDTRLNLRFATTTSFSVLLWYQWFCNYTYNYVLRSFIRTHERTGYSTILISRYISSSTSGTDISIYDLLKFFNTNACFYIEKQDTYNIYLQKKYYDKDAHNIIARKGLYFSLRARLNIMLFGCVRSTWYIWQKATFKFDI